MVAIITAIFKLIFFQDLKIFGLLTNAIFQNAKISVDISLGLIGILCFWLGILELVEKNGIAQKISHKLYPFFKVIMKDIPKDSPAISSIVLNMSANFLGLDNAATPIGIRAMEQLQEHNKDKTQASDAQILFMLINSSSVCFIPITIFMYRAQMGAIFPTDVFIPILLATSISTLVAFLSIAVKQHIDLTNVIIRKMLFYFILFIMVICCGFSLINHENRLVISSFLGNVILILAIGYIIYVSIKSKIKCYDVFIDGAKNGFNVAIKIIPYLVSMLVAIGVFRASGFLDFVLQCFRELCEIYSIDNTFVDVLPTAFIKPLSGSGARAMMIETMNNFGANSLQGFMASVIQGSTETTFYVIAVYFGAVKISNTRYALKYGLWADLAGIISAIIISYLFYGN